MDTPVTIGYNFKSGLMDRKGIIKISDKFFTDDEINRLSVVAPNIVLNTIRNYEVVEKNALRPPTSTVASSNATTPSASPTTSLWRRSSMSSTRSRAS